jgi:hypothetical protein
MVHSCTGDFPRFSSLKLAVPPGTAFLFSAQG